MIPMLVGTFFTLEAADITAALAYVGNIFDDVKLLVLLAIGIPLAFMIIKRAISLAPKK
ncbi:unnamed protein product [marine sediment metagenome]|uniref:Uncharacterized protein n=1 Tax=marine sediment metagenome TaxID=412755 RepID=X1KST2_9ZZZZ